MEDRVEGSSMVGRSRQRAVKVTKGYIYDIKWYKCCYICLGRMPWGRG